MKTLCMDTSHRHLVLVLLEDEKVMASSQQEAWKRQSETIFVELIALMEKVGWQVDDLDEVVITRGPGSYTGIRIVMSIAKVLCTQKPIALYSISTLLLYAGLEDCCVMLDARGKRAYFGDCCNGIVKKECILTLDEIATIKNRKIIGDTDLIGFEKPSINFVENFAQLRPYYEKVENVHAFVPVYLKEDSAYLVK